MPWIRVNGKRQWVEPTPVGKCCGITFYEWKSYREHYERHRVV